MTAERFIAIPRHKCDPLFGQRLMCVQINETQVIASLDSVGAHGKKNVFNRQDVSILAYFPTDSGAGELGGI